MAVRSDAVALIPAYNEARHVAAVVAGAGAVVEQVIVVDDGSSDDTAAVARSAGALVLHQPRNLGKGAALSRGLEWARAERVAMVVTLDADGQHDPAEIPLFLAAADEEVGDLIIGRREFAAMPPTRRIANTVGALLIRWALGHPVHDNQSGYRLLNSAALEVLRPRRSDFAAEVEQIVAALEAGLRIGWVPIRTIYGAETSHFRPVHDSVAFLTLVRQLRRARLAQTPVARSG
jgi:glycosyltransferase involved in cell wall biosynthesis